MPFRGIRASYGSGERQPGGRWRRRDSDAEAPSGAGPPRHVHAPDLERCPWSIPWGLLRRSSRRGATNRRVLPTVPACQAAPWRSPDELSCQGRYVGLLVPRRGWPAHRVSGWHGLRRRIQPAQPGSAWPTGMLTEITPGGNKVNRGLLKHWGEQRTFAQLACRGSGTRVVRKGSMGRTCRPGAKIVGCGSSEFAHGRTLEQGACRRGPRGG